MNCQPLVCICVPTFNAAATLSETLESITAQTYKNIRIVVVDNASEDETLEIAKRHAARDRRIEVVANTKNVGGEENFNRCISLASGDFLTIFHSDDIYEPGIVERQVQVLSGENKIGLVFCRAQIIDERGRPLGLSRIPSIIVSRFGGRLNYRQMLALVCQFGNPFISPSAMAPAALWKQVGRFNGSSYKTSADLDVWLRMARTGHDVIVLGQPLIRYRSSTHSYSFHYKRQRLGPHDVLLVLDDYVAKDRALLTEWDLENYEFFKFKDRVNRAINFLISGDLLQARFLIIRDLSWAIAWTAVRSLWQAKILSIALFVLILSFIPLGEKGRNKLRRLRFG